MPQTSGSRIIALDFDGVICNSVNETASTGWRAARTWFSQMPQTPSNSYFSAFAQLRPKLETGYESILLAILLHSGADVAHTFANYPSVLENVRAEHALPVEQLIERFGDTRDHWIRTNRQEWLALHSFYPELPDCIRAWLDTPDIHVYIITTKEKRFALELLAVAGLSFSESHVYGLEAGKKKTVLANLGTQHSGGRTFHFVEDRLATLLTVAQDDLDTRWQLHLCDWGYNTTDEQEDAAAHERINLITQELFSNLAD